MAHPPHPPVAARCRVLRQPVRLLVASLALVQATPTLAVELGRLRVLSSVGQPLHLEFPLQDIASGATASDYTAQVQAQLAQDTSLQAPQPWPSQIEIHPATDGGLVAVVRSEASVAQPAVGLQLQLTGPEGPYRKQVVVLLPAAERAVAPELRLARAVGHTDAARLAANGIATRGGTAAGRQVARSGAGAAAAGPRSTLRVVQGDTLGRIVSRLQRDGQYGDASAQQLMQALLQDNPDAFIRGNVHGLKAGAELQLPDADTLAGIESAEARRLVEDHSASWAVSRGAGRAPVVAERSPSAQAASGRVSAAPAAAPAAARDELRLSAANGARGQDAQGAIDQLRDERAATAQALAEAQGRVGTLAANVAELQALLQAQDAVLARLEGGAATPEGASAASGDAATSAAATSTAADAAATSTPGTASVASGTLAANGSDAGSGNGAGAGTGAAASPALANGTLVASAGATSGLGLSAGVAPIAPATVAPAVTASASPWLWAGIGLLVLLVAAVLAWMLRSHRAATEADAMAERYLDGITLDLDPPANRPSRS